MSKILTAKDKIKQICSLIGGVVLCVFILVPLFTALLLWLLLRLSFLLPNDNFAFFLFAESILQATAFGASGFVMGIIISYGSTTKEIRATLLGSLITATFYIIQIVFIIFTLGGSAKNKAYLLFEHAVYIVCLLALAMLGALLIARRRRLRVEKGA